MQFFSTSYLDDSPDYVKEYVEKVSTKKNSKSVSKITCVVLMWLLFIGAALLFYTMYFEASEALENLGIGFSVIGILVLWVTLFLAVLVRVMCSTAVFMCEKECKNGKEEKAQEELDKECKSGKEEKTQEELDKELRKMREASDTFLLSKPFLVKKGLFRRACDGFKRFLHLSAIGVLFMHGNFVLALIASIGIILALAFYQLFIYQSAVSRLKVLEEELKPKERVTNE